MTIITRLVPAQGNSLAGRRTLAFSKAIYGRTTPYRRLHNQTCDHSHFGVSRSPVLPFLFLPPPSASFLRPLNSAAAIQPEWHNFTARRDFFVSAFRCQQDRQQENVRNSSGQNKEAKEKTETEKLEQESASSEQSKAEEGESENEKQEGKGGKEEAPPPPPHGNKTPWQVFTETLKSEFKASKEWNESTKALASSAHQFTESESVRKARAAYEQATKATSSTTQKVLTGTGRAIGHGAAWTWDTTVIRGVRAGVRATGHGIEKATRPVRETTAYKKTVGSIKETMDNGSSSRYGGWVEKEERKKQRELRDLEEIRSGKRPQKFEEDPNAGTNVTLHKDSKWKESWRDFKDSSKVVQSLFEMKNVYNESENPLISTARSISDRVAGWFAENEQAQVIKKFREMDPTFQLEPFLREMREYILPEVLDAYVKGDTETLKLWLSAAQYQVYATLTQQYTAAGLVSDGRILDIRNVEILQARLLEPGDIPVFIVTCRTQEVHVYRHSKTGELAAGMEDKVQLVTYAIGVTRLPDEISDPETRGWRLIELQKSARDWI